MFHVYIPTKKDLDSKSRVEDVIPTMCLFLTFVISTSLMPRHDTTNHAQSLHPSETGSVEQLWGPKRTLGLTLVIEYDLITNRRIQIHFKNNLLKLTQNF